MKIRDILSHVTSELVIKKPLVKLKLVHAFFM